ncbi:MAG: hypothetical protein ACRCZD_12745 [Phycicoccus sp.]
MSTETPNPAANANLKLVLGVVLIVLGAVGYVTLRILNIDEAGLTLFITPFATYLLVEQKVEKQQQDTAQTLGRIEHQTNGRLKQEREDGWRQGFEAGRQSVHRDPPPPPANV